jgi:hypothetical protein
MFASWLALVGAPVGRRTPRIGVRAMRSCVLVLRRDLDQLLAKPRFGSRRRRSAKRRRADLVRCRGLSR